jgi:hypothetical protein
MLSSSNLSSIVSSFKSLSSFICWLSHEILTALAILSFGSIILVLTKGLYFFPSKIHKEIACSLT